MLVVFVSETSPILIKKHGAAFRRIDLIYFLKYLNRSWLPRGRDFKSQQGQEHDIFLCFDILILLFLIIGFNNEIKMAGVYNKMAAFQTTKLNKTCYQ